MSNTRILLIDDDYDLSFVISTSLEIFGNWEVVMTNNPHEGLTLAQTEHPDIILLDVMMPQMDGITLFGLLKNISNTQKIPVIFMTAKVQHSDLEEFHNLGVAGVISKPFDPLKLVEKIKDILKYSE